jgi:hypothetical protein
MQINPSAGGNGSDVVVSGDGWQTGMRVTITYLDALRRPTGQSAEAVPDATGHFTATIVAYDPQNIPGPHYVDASNALGQSKQITFTAT